MTARTNTNRGATADLTEPTLYDVLGVPKDASAEIIASAYRELLRQYHPDKSESREMLDKVVEAGRILTDSQQRRDYDASLVKRKRGGAAESNPKRMAPLIPWRDREQKKVRLVVSESIVSRPDGVDWTRNPSDQLPRTGPLQKLFIRISTQRRFRASAVSSGDDVVSRNLRSLAEALSSHFGDSRSGSRDDAFELTLSGDWPSYALPIRSILDHCDPTRLILDEWDGDAAILDPDHGAAFDYLLSPAVEDEPRRDSLSLRLNGGYHACAEALSRRLGDDTCRVTRLELKLPSTWHRGFGVRLASIRIWFASPDEGGLASVLNAAADSRLNLDALTMRGIQYSGEASAFDAATASAFTRLCRNVVRLGSLRVISLSRYLFPTGGDHGLASLRDLTALHLETSGCRTDDAREVAETIANTQAGFAKLRMICTFDDAECLEIVASALREICVLRGRRVESVKIVNKRPIGEDGLVISPATVRHLADAIASDGIARLTLEGMSWEDHGEWVRPILRVCEGPPEPRLTALSLHWHGVFVSEGVIQDILDAVLRNDHLVRFALPMLPDVEQGIVLDQLATNRKAAGLEVDPTAGYDDDDDDDENDEGFWAW